MVLIWSKIWSVFVLIKYDIFKSILYTWLDVELIEKWYNRPRNVSKIKPNNWL